MSPASARVTGDPYVLYTVTDHNELAAIDIGCTVLLPPGPTFCTTIIGPTQDSASGPLRRIRGLAYDARYDVMYGMTREGDLVTVDRSTGATAFLFSIPGANPATQFWGGLAFDGVVLSIGNLYTTDAFGGNELVRITFARPTQTGFSSAVLGSTSFSGTNPPSPLQILGLDFYPLSAPTPPPTFNGTHPAHGVLYGSNRNNDNIVVVDTTSGAVTMPFGNATNGVPNVQEIAFHPGTGRLYIIHDASHNALLSVYDFSTSTATEVGLLPFGIVDTNSYGFGGLAFAPKPSLLIKPKSTHAFEGRLLGPVVVATFTDRRTSLSSQYSATIDWGDGTSSPGVITGPTGGRFNIRGSHTYAEEGAYTTTVTVTETALLANTGSVTGSVSVGPVPLTISCAVQSTVPALSFSGAVATFTHANPLEPRGVNEFSATINWGDGTPVTTGTVAGSSPAYTVTGTHTYSTGGTYTVRVTVTDDGETRSKSCTLKIQPPFCLFHPLVIGARSDPWLAGMPNGTTDVPPNSSAPANSPVLLGGFTAFGASYITFSGVSGTPRFNPSASSSSGCDGHPSYQNVTHGAANSMASLTAPVNALVGVFLDASVPTGPPPGPYLDFSIFANQNLAIISPGLRQPFFIGDGVTSLGVIQKIFIPSGATRLFLGTMDQQKWTDNAGRCEVQQVCYYQ